MHKKPHFQAMVGISSSSHFHPFSKAMAAMAVSVRRVGFFCRTASMPRIYMIMVAAALSTAAARKWMAWHAGN